MSTGEISIIASRIDDWKSLADALNSKIAAERIHLRNLCSKETNNGINCPFAKIKTEYYSGSYYDKGVEETYRVCDKCLRHDRVTLRTNSWYE